MTNDTDTSAAADDAATAASRAVAIWIADYGSDEGEKRWNNLNDALQAWAKKNIAERDTIAAELAECEPYLKEGQSPAERLELNHREILVLIKLLAKEKERAEAAEAKLAEARDAEVRRKALEEAAAIIGVRVGHGGSVLDCGCGMCVARREDHQAILALIEKDKTNDG